MRAIAIGTAKGGYLLDEHLEVTDGPLFPGWKVTAWTRLDDGSVLAALGSNWFGPSLQRSDDLESWEPIAEGPAYAGSSPELRQIWTLTQIGSSVYAGVEEAGVFRSEDRGTTWEPLQSINEWPGRERWLPGLGGLAAHHVIGIDDRLWVGISAVGVFRSDDRGAGFVRGDRGVSLAAEATEETAAGFCVHSITLDPDAPDRMWRQDHSGVYRSADGGLTWSRAEEGLPARFGFPIRRDHASGRLFVVPMESDENRVVAGGVFRIYRSDDDAASWHASGAGWSDEPSFDTVLRNAMAADGAGTVVVGTTGGNVWVTRDAGDTWAQAPVQVPRILSMALL